MAWIRADPEGVARSLVAAQEEIDRLRSEARTARRLAVGGERQGYPWDDSD